MSAFIFAWVGALAVGGMVGLTTRGLRLDSAEDPDYRKGGE